MTAPPGEDLVHWLELNRERVIDRWSRVMEDSNWRKDKSAAGRDGSAADYTRKARHILDVSLAHLRNSGAGDLKDWAREMVSRRLTEGHTLGLIVRNTVTLRETLLELLRLDIPDDARRLPYVEESYRLCGDHFYAYATSVLHLKEESERRFREMMEQKVSERTRKLEEALQEIEQANQELVQTQDQLIRTEKLASLGQLVAGVAHELNNPLTAILGFSQVLLRGQDKGRESKGMEYLGIIASEAERSRRIVQNLLDFAHQRRGVKRVVDFNNEVRRALALREYALRNTNITVELDLAPDLPPVWADPAQIQQMLLNLILNAEQAITEERVSGSITLKTELVPGESDEEASHLRLGVTDDGHGIAPEHLSRVFDPFFTTKEVGRGTGLGLSVCHGIVTEHGGRIWVDSQVNEWTTVCVELPQAGGEEEAVEAPVVDEPQFIPATEHPMLVVDDEPSVRELIAEVARDLGYQVVLVESGLEAVARLRQEKFGNVLIDLRMPGAMDGTMLYEFIKENQPDLKSRIIFLTGDTMNLATQRFLRSTGCPTIAKPFRIEDLAQLLSLAGGDARRLALQP